MDVLLVALELVFASETVVAAVFAVRYWTREPLCTGAVSATVMT